MKQAGRNITVYIEALDDAQTQQLELFVSPSEDFTVLSASSSSMLGVCALFYLRVCCVKKKGRERARE